MLDYNVDLHSKTASGVAECAAAGVEFAASAGEFDAGFVLTCFLLRFVCRQG